MYLDYSKLEFDRDGHPETPELVLKTLDESTIGIIPGVSGLKLNVKFSEPSTISFDVSAKIDGEPNWIYDRLTGYKVIYTKRYGVYIAMEPEQVSDGIRDVKHIEGYSIEYALNNKKFFIEEGTYKFFDQMNPSNVDTVIGRILEVATGWSVGYVSPQLAQRYRTFDAYDNYLLPFMYNEAKEKFRCIFVFDPYERTFSVYDADEERPAIPIYLDYENLVKELSVRELSDELITALRPYGADELDIRAVNPTGMNWIYDLSYFIEDGSIPDRLAEKWKVWQRSVLNKREYYKGLTALRASATARLLAARAALADLNGELETLQAQQNVTVQAYALETTDAGKRYQQGLLDEINRKISAKKSEIGARMAEVEQIEEETDPENPDSYAARIQSIVDELSITSYFTEEEYNTLSKYFIEQDLTEDTFIASDVESDVSGTSYELIGESMRVSGSAISEVDLTAEYKKRMYVLTGRGFSMVGEYSISGDIIRGTLETQNGGSFVMSVYAGFLRVNDKTAQSGMITVSGTLTGFSNDIRDVTVDGVTTREGASLSFSISDGFMYLTANVNDYQKYSVQMELYDFAVETLSDLATPTYEFSVDSGNFIFADEFAPFRNKLELGKGFYLKISKDRVITPYLIEFELDFENENSFSMVFSNRFKRYDEVNTLKDMVEKSYSYSRSFDANKHLYNQTTKQAPAVSTFMNGMLDAAKNAIIGAANQSVLINGAGINIGGDSKYQMRLIDSMIAMTDDNWGTAKLAIGRFATPETGEVWGVNAELLAGKLIIGNNMVLQNPTDDGVMQFMVDSSGAWLNNSTFVLQKDGGGKLLIDPRYGIVAGTGDIFSVSGTTVIQTFADVSGNPIMDEDGMPKNTNFYLDLRDGSAYFRGSGSFNGVVRAKDFISDITGESMFTSSGKLSADYVEIKDASGNTSSLTKTARKLESDISTAAGESSTALQTAKKITWLVKSGTDESNFELTSRMAQLTAESIDLSGYVTFSSLKEGGTTEIDGGRITTGTINAERLNLSGCITFSDLNKDTQDVINGKTETFFGEPTSYHAGDLYFHDGATYRAKISRTYYLEADWEKVAEAGAKLPTYIQETKITSTTIESPDITGGDISGGAYHDLDKLVNLTLDPYTWEGNKSAGLTLTANDGSPIFRVTPRLVLNQYTGKNEYIGADLRLKDMNVLSAYTMDSTDNPMIITLGDRDLGAFLAAKSFVVPVDDLYNMESYVKFDLRGSTINIENTTLSGNVVSLGTSWAAKTAEKFNLYLVVGRPSSGSSLVSTLIPKQELGNRYQLSDDGYYLTFTLFNTGVTVNSNPNNGAITAVYGIK